MINRFYNNARAVIWNTGTATRKRREQLRNEEACCKTDAKPKRFNKDSASKVLRRRIAVNMVSKKKNYKEYLRTLVLYGSSCDRKEHDIS